MSRCGQGQVLFTKVDNVAQCRRKVTVLKRWFTIGYTIGKTPAMLPVALIRSETSCSSFPTLIFKISKRSRRVLALSEVTVVRARFPKHSEPRALAILEAWVLTLFALGILRNLRRIRNLPLQSRWLSSSSRIGAPVAK